MELSISDFEHWAECGHPIPYPLQVQAGPGSQEELGSAGGANQRGRHAESREKHAGAAKRGMRRGWLPSGAASPTTIVT